MLKRSGAKKQDMVCDDTVCVAYNNNKQVFFKKKKKFKTPEAFLKRQKMFWIKNQQSTCSKVSKQERDPCGPQPVRKPFTNLTRYTKYAKSVYYNDWCAW